MGNNTNPTYIFLKGNTFYFNRHVPRDIRSYYKSNRVIICLKTKRRFEALRAAKSIAQRLEDYWLSLRMSNIDIPGLNLIRNNLESPSYSSCIKLSEALEVYLKLKGVNKDKTFYICANRNIKYVIDLLGDRPLDSYSSSEAASFRDRLRAVECPSEIIDQLGGWSLKSVGQGYGKGYSSSITYSWLKKTKLN